MRTCVIVNPRAGSAAAAVDLERDLLARGFVVRETDGPGGARSLAKEAVEAGFGRVVAAGGDGTVSDVVNGLRDAERPATLGVIPLGTGNDLARTLLIPDLAAAVAALDADVRRTFDLMRVTSEEGVRYGINVATGGFSGQVDEAVTDAMKLSWGPLAYLRGAVDVLPDLTGYETAISYDGGPEERVSAFNIVVANAKMCGGGMNVCSEANPEDGLLDVVVVRWASAVELATVGVRLLAGDWLGHELVEHHRVRRLGVRSRPGMWFNVDGELITRGPVQFEVLPAAQRVIVGAGYP